jgi:membrane protease YdiL (CAAX protease family)
MSFLLIIKRAAAFIRTCLPAHPSSWLLLLGAVFLFISHTLRWWPGSSYYSRPLLWAGCNYLMSVPIFAAGVTAYYLAVVGFKKPARRLLDSILLPVIVGLAAKLIVAFYWFRDVGEPARFVNQVSGAPHLWQPRILFALALNLSVGFQFASVGFVLISVFFVLYSWGRASLPIHLPAQSVSDAFVPEDEYRRSMFFVWMMIAMIFITGLPEPALEMFASSAIFHFAQLHPDWFSWLRQLSHALLLLAFVCIALGKAGRKMIPAMLRIPRAKYLAASIVIPAAIAYVAPVASYLHARIPWSLDGWGKLVPPSPSSFLGLPPASAGPYLLYPLVEEIAWRGYLQPRFVRRYGLVRGIFLVGVVWGAFHYIRDFNPAMTAQDVCIGVVGRLLVTVSLSYVLAWLTIRSESILPAALAHATYNLGWSLPIHSPQWLTLLLWAVAGFVLLRCFLPPSHVTIAEPAMPPAPEPEPSEV